MRIAFYCPLKSPNHPVPSGDRLMARLLITAMEKAGHDVEIVSELRSFVSDPNSKRHGEIDVAAKAEKDRITGQWRDSAPPDLWFTYHPYYKAPDLLGPGLSAGFSIPYVTAEASYSDRRNIGHWANAQSHLLASIKQAAVNICMTERDRCGLEEAAPEARVLMLKPFLDPSSFLAESSFQSRQLATVAMMRAGDKLQSYSILAKALALLEDCAWQLTVVGDGPERAAVQALFAQFAPGRIMWLGERSTEEIASIFSKSSLYVWPGVGEAYGLAYLEAQAAGLPVIGQNIAGVPEVVIDGKTGLLTEPGNVEAYAGAIGSLLDNDPMRAEMASAARAFVLDERSIDSASVRLNEILQYAVKDSP